MLWLVVVTAALSSPAGEHIERASQLIDDFRYEEALGELQRARTVSAQSCVEMRAVERLSGIAHASLERSKEASAAFARLVAMNPLASISYSLSPKVTLLFSRERKRLSALGDLRLQLNAPFAQAADLPISMRVRLTHDPLEQAQDGAIAFRLNDGEWQTRSFPLDGAVDLKLRPFNTESDATLSYFVEARDAKDNCLYALGTAESPRSMRLVYTYRSPTWPVWTGAGVSTALLVAGTTFGLLSRNAQSVFDEEVSGIPPAQQDPARRAQAEDDARNYSRAANVSFVSAGVSALVTGILFLMLNDGE